LHPRIKFGAHGVDQLNLITVDLTFVDVTSPAIAQGLLNKYQADWRNYPRRGAPSVEPHSGEPEPGDPHHGCTLRILELTAGEPTAWAVVIPAAVKSSISSFNIIQFFAPAGVAYLSALNVSSKSPYNTTLPRYTRDPPIWRPFRFRSSQIQTDAPLIEPYGYGGFEGQLAASNKPVLFVIPLSPGEVTRTKRATDPGLMPLLGSLLTALFSDGHIGSESDGVVTVKRLALAGYSAGGTPMLTAFANNTNTTSELYFFDVTEPLPGNAIEKWFKQWKTRKIRMITGAYLTPRIAEAIRDKLAGPSSDRQGDITFTPESASFYDTPGNMYHRSFQPPGTDPFLLSQRGSPPSVLSQRTGIFLSNAEMGSLVFSVEDLKLDKPVPVASKVEASGMLFSVWGAHRVRTIADLDQIFRSFSPPPFKGLRHQWPIIGGTGAVGRYPYGVQKDTADTSVFEGYLLFCLKDSAFK
jgi:hypothetical protein